MSKSTLITIVWFVIAILVSLAIQIPMLWHGDYHFVLANMLIVFIPIIALRNSLDFFKIGFHRNKWIRYFIFVLNIFLFIFIINRLEIVMGIVDSMDIQKLLTSDTISFMEQVDLFEYVNMEFLLFSVASFVSLLVYNFRILSSFWLRSQLKSETKLS